MDPFWPWSGREAKSKKEKRLSAVVLPIIILEKSLGEQKIFRKKRAIKSSNPRPTRLSSEDRLVCVLLVRVGNSACFSLGTRRVRLPGAPFPNLHLKVDKRLYAAKMKHGDPVFSDKNAE